MATAEDLTGWMFGIQVDYGSIYAEWSYRHICLKAANFAACWWRGPIDSVRLKYDKKNSLFNELVTTEFAIQIQRAPI